MVKNGKKFNTNLFLLLAGRLISDIGSGIQMLIMPLYIIDIGGTAGTVGLFSFLSLVPVLLVYPFGGVLGDRLNRKMIMVAADFSSAFFVLLLAFISSIGRMNLAILLSIQVLVYLFYGFFDPATKGMIPQLVPEEELNKTNSKVASLRIISGLAAPLIAVTLYTAFGITLLFIINGISFLISGSSEMFIRYKSQKEEIRSGIKGIFKDMAEGVRFINNNRLIKNLSLYFLIVFALIQPVFAVVLPVFFRTKLNYSDTQYGIIQIALFCGAMIGSILAGLMGKEGRLRKTLKTGISALSLSMLLFAVLLFPRIVTLLGNDSLLYLVLFSGIMLFQYAFIMFFYIPVQTVIQKITPEDFMSRVFSIVGMISKGGMPLGALVYGLVLERIEIHRVALAAALLITLVSMGFLRSKTVKMVES